MRHIFHTEPEPGVMRHVVALRTTGGDQVNICINSELVAWFDPGHGCLYVMPNYTKNHVPAEIELDMEALP